MNTIGTNNRTIADKLVKLSKRSYILALDYATVNSVSGDQDYSKMESIFKMKDGSIIVFDSYSATAIE